MIDREKVIKGLECCIKSNDDCECPDECPYYEKCWEGEQVKLNDQLMKDAKELLKEQQWVSAEEKKMTLKQIAENHGLTPDGVDYALRQYQTVISEITHGMLSKPSYDARTILSVAQDRWCETCELMEEKKPRVLTLDEVLTTSGAGWVEIWFSADDNDGEPESKELMECAWCKGNYLTTDGDFSDSDYLSNNYNKHYGVRIWSAKPTPEEQEATPWQS